MHKNLSGKGTYPSVVKDCGIKLSHYHQERKFTLTSYTQQKCSHLKSLEGEMSLGLPAAILTTLLLGTI